MKSVYISDIKAGTTLVGQTFAISEIRAATDKNGNTYYDLTLADKTGQIKGKIWSEAAVNIEKSILKTGKLIAVDAACGEYRGSVQLTISKAVSVDETQLTDYLESSMFPADDMMAELEKIALKEIENKQIRELFKNLLGDPEVVRKLKYWPAAVSFHHDFRSGLLQHILECLALASGLERFYPDLDFDIVRAGIILHDIGKLDEIDASGLVPQYTVVGSILGHLYIGTQYIDKYAPKDMPNKILLHLKHIILSHHGDRANGTPVLPATAEALLVSGIDETSADAQKGVKGVKEPANEYGMTSYNRWLERWMWADSKVGTDIEQPPEPVTQEMLEGLE